MSWPALAQSVKALDLSQYQRKEDAPPIDFKKLHEENPEIKLLIIRASSVWLVKDRDFEYNYDEAKKHFDVAVYVNINPSKSVADHFAHWDAILGSRQPELILFDCETSAGQGSSKCTEIIRGVLDHATLRWAWTRIGIYSAAWWWNPNIKHGWEGDYLFWIAHYPYFVQDPNGSWRVVYSFEESDPFLPIDNDFTPKRPTGVENSNVIGWQFSSSGRIVPIAERVDLNYFKKWFYDDVFGGGVVPPSDYAERIRRETKDLRSEMDEINLIAEHLDDIADEMEG